MFWNSKPKRIFLDYASTTPLDKEVLKKMTEYSATNFANPSALYNEALVAKETIKKAREKIAEIVHCQSSEIIFTSGGTESNNLALLGVFEATKRDGFTPHIITTNIEHPSILEVCKEIEKRGGEVTYIKVLEDGLVNRKDIIEAIKENTVLVSVMFANNEIGTIQPIQEIGKGIKEYRNKNSTEFPYFHTDACQAFSFVPIDVLKMHLDLLTLDGIKMYGPRGTGMLFVRNGTTLEPLVFGGGQEKGLRSGTEDVASIMGFAEAVEIAHTKRESESVRLSSIRDYGIDLILNTFPQSTINGSRENRLSNNINICFKGLDAEFAVVHLDMLGISASYSSSCQTLKEDSSSYVIENLGKKECRLSSLRFTLGRESKKSDIDDLITALQKIVK